MDPEDFAEGVMTLIEIGRQDPTVFVWALVIVGIILTIIEFQIRKEFKNKKPGTRWK